MVEGTAELLEGMLLTIKLLGETMALLDDFRMHNCAFFSFLYMFFLFSCPDK